jgi:hypothetical protein
MNGFPDLNTDLESRIRKLVSKVERHEKEILEIKRDQKTTRQRISTLSVTIGEMKYGDSGD